MPSGLRSVENIQHGSYKALSPRLWNSSSPKSQSREGVMISGIAHRGHRGPNKAAAWKNTVTPCPTKQKPLPGPCKGTWDDEMNYVLNIPGISERCFFPFFKFIFNPHPRVYLLTLERGRERQRCEREIVIRCLSHAPQPPGIKTTT